MRLYREKRSCPHQYCVVVSRHVRCIAFCRRLVLMRDPAMNYAGIKAVVYWKIMGERNRLWRKENRITRRRQTNRLNRCLNDYPKGIIIGKDVTIGRYAIGEHELTMEQPTYHVGFPRKPVWMEGNEVG